MLQKRCCKSDLALFIDNRFAKERTRKVGSSKYMSLLQNIVSFIRLFCKRDLAREILHSLLSMKSARSLLQQRFCNIAFATSLLQKSPIKETIFCTRDLYFEGAYFPPPLSLLRHLFCKRALLKCYISSFAEYLIGLFCKRDLASPIKGTIL